MDKLPSFVKIASLEENLPVQGGIPTQLNGMRLEDVFQAVNADHPAGLVEPTLSQALDALIHGDALNPPVSHFIPPVLPRSSDIAGPSVSIMHSVVPLPGPFAAVSAIHPPISQPSREQAAEARAARARKRKGSSSIRSTLQKFDDEGSLEDKSSKAKERAAKNRESAARSRARRLEYQAALEKQVEELKHQNKVLRTKVVAVAQAPKDRHAGKHDGEILRRTRTTPL